MNFTRGIKPQEYVGVLPLTHKDDFPILIFPRREFLSFPYTPFRKKRVLIIDWILKPFSIVVIGGIGTIKWPIGTAFINVLLSQRLAEYFHVRLFMLRVIE
jgi:hypothetical protein